MKKIAYTGLCLLVLISLLTLLGCQGNIPVTYGAYNTLSLKLSAPEGMLGAADIELFTDEECTASVTSSAQSLVAENDTVNYSLSDLLTGVYYAKCVLYSDAEKEIECSTMISAGIFVDDASNKGKVTEVVLEKDQLACPSWVLIKEDGNEGLKKIMIPAGLLTDYTFRQNNITQSKVLSIDLHDVYSIGDRCFENCDHLESVRVLSSLNAITVGSNAFSGAGTSGDGFSFESNVSVAVASEAFSSSNMISFSFDKLNDGRDSAFKQTAITVADLTGSTAVDLSDTFPQCSSLKTITIPASVTTMNQGALNGCTALTDVHFLSTDPSSGINNCLKQLNQPFTVYVPKGTIDKYKALGSDWQNYTYVEE